MDTASVRYAGFWKRVVAAIIDGFVLAIVNFVIFIPALGMLGLGMAGTDRDMGLDRSPGLLLALVGTWMLSAFAVFAAGWLYFALMESSAKGGTLGKMALGIRVTDLNGNRISFARASGRYFGKIISAAILYIGFLMTAFTQQKQALHDIIAGCLVVIK